MAHADRPTRTPAVNYRRLPVKLDGWLPVMIAVTGTAILCPIVLGVLREREILDLPNERSSHTDPTPRGGGAALVIPLLLATLLGRGAWPLRGGLLIAGMALATVGLVEDVRGIPIGARLGLQVLTGVATAAMLLRGEHLGFAVSGAVGVAGVLWLVTFSNAFNFMDGINGISAVTATIAGLTYAWLGRARFPLLVDGGLIVAGASVAFLPFNFPRPRMFLGDVGSYLLGSWLAVLAVLALRDRVGPVAAVAPLALYIGDTGLTLMRRVVEGEPWRRPHRRHAYQRLVQAGWSHARVTAVLGALTTVCSLLGVMARRRSPGFQAGDAALIASLVLAYVGVSWTTRPAPVGD